MNRNNFHRAPVLSLTVSMLAVCVLAGLLRAILIVPLQIPLDPNEGWNAYHAAAAITTGNPYPTSGSFLVNNYPPISFYLVGLLGSWLGDNVICGRIVSLAAFIALAVSIAVILRNICTHLCAATLASLLFGAALFLTSDYIGMDDPQLLGHAFQFAGLLLLLGGRRRPIDVVASGALFAAGGFVKHNLFALPLSCVLWLAIVDRRGAVQFTCALLALSLAGVVAVELLVGVNLFRVLTSPRTFSAAQLASNFLDWLPMMIIPLCGLAWLVWRHGKEESVWLAGIYAVISVVSGTMLLGGAGVDVNAMFDADIALALCVGLAVSHMLDESTNASRAMAQAFALFCIVPFATVALRSTDWRDPSFWLHPLSEETAQAGRDIAFLKMHAGPAMCEDLTFCYWAGKIASVDVFNLNQQFETGARDPAPFLFLIRSHYFAVVEFDETSPFPFPRTVEHAFVEDYRMDHRDDEGTFFVPRQDLNAPGGRNRS